MAGREDSVKDIFDKKFRSACTHYTNPEIKFSLNGQDQFINADTMFSTFEKFFIIEFKSQKSSIKDEIKKTSACTLCCGLSQDDEMMVVHENCHFIMWGRKKDDLYARFDVYAQAVCNPVTLPECEGAKVINGTAADIEYEILADQAGKNAAGVDITTFRNYLAWLFGDRKKQGEKGDFKATVYATSHDYALTGKAFDSIEDLYTWAMGNEPEEDNSYTPLTSSGISPWRRKNK